MRLATIATALLFLSLSGCASLGQKYAQYDIGLEQVERPADAEQRYGDFSIVKTDTTLSGSSDAESNTTEYTYEDELVAVSWIVVPELVAFEMENKSDQTIKIIWDEAVFIDPDGGSHRVMHSGVKYIDKEKPQPPTIIARGANVSDVIQPTDYVSYTSGQYGGWREDPILQPYSSASIEQLQAAEENEGKTFRVLLPLEIEGVTNEYTFVFRVEDVQVPEPSETQ